MAKLRGAYGTGYVRRLGNTVGRKIGNGEYGIFNYQPDVINPRTDAQTDQRAKFNFCVKMATVLGDDALVGLSNLRYKTVRNAFTALNIGNVIMNPLGGAGEVQPSLSAALMQVSHGGAVMPTPVIEDGGEIKVAITPVTNYGIDANKPSEMIAVAICLSEIDRGGYRAAMVRIPYTSFEDGVATAEKVKLAVDVGSEAMPIGGWAIEVYCYNVRYNLNDVRYHYGDLALGGTQSAPVFYAVDTLKTLSRGALFSRNTAHHTRITE